MWPQPLLVEPLAIEQARLILRAAVTQNGDDGVTPTELPRNADRGGDIDSARAAEKEPFFAQKPINKSNSVGILDVNCIVNRRVLQIGRDPCDTDALGNRTV